MSGFTAASQPLVSVLTPSFNQGRWLADNLGSVACQTHRNVEQIVMDGGSSDETLGILASAPPHVRWHSEPDRGQSHALNKAFSQAEGDIIGWLNSDDAYFSPDVLTTVVDCFERHPEADIVYGHAALVNADGLILQMIWVPNFSQALFRLLNYIYQPAVFIRRSALDETIVDESYDSSMDRELWLRLGREHRFQRVNKVLAIDRHYPARKSNAQPGLAEAEGERLAEAYGRPRGPWVSGQRAAAKLLIRILGVRALSEADDELAFAGRYDGYFRLLRRQLTMRRAAMPGVQDWQPHRESLAS